MLSKGLVWDHLFENNKPYHTRLYLFTRNRFEPSLKKTNKAYSFL